MSPNTVGAELKRRHLWIWALCFLWAIGACFAQEPANEPPGDQGQIDSGPPEEDEPLEQEPIPIPIRAGEESQSLAGLTFVDDVFHNVKNRWGFSLSAYQAYTSNLASNDSSRKDSGITAFIPRTFFNFGKRKSRFHIDLGGGYRHYNNRRDLSGLDYYGDAQYSYRISRRTSFQLSDQFTSSLNDAWSFLSLYSPLHYNHNFSNEVLFNRQRVTRNSFIAQLDHSPSRKIRLGVFGGLRSYRYSRGTLSDSDAIEFGGSFYYRVAKWLYLTNSASAYVNVSGDYLEQRIYRLQVGGLEFHPTDSWRIWAGGGVNLSDYEHRTRTGENISAGIGYTAQNLMFSATYQRGFTSLIGFSRLLQSDVVNASLGYRLTRWMSTRLESYYYRSTEEYGKGILETLSGGGGLEFALCRSLMMTLNAYYQNQRTQNNFSIPGLGLNRFTGSIGIQYVWPSRRGTPDYGLYGY
ncbi:MAG: hypothetical protein JXA73_07040 [Acidobacteria bacterium]|nr:hypothetical protein [Acidobacteriota bacterium]